MKILYLSLKEKWYRLIESGVKKEEYRVYNDYWKKRLIGKEYTHVQFTLGYPKRDDYSRRMTFTLNGIEHQEGKEEWGAEKGVKYFVLKIGDRIYE